MIVSLVLAGLTILGQISWVLVPERTPLTIATVVTFFLASAFHAVATRGVRWAASYIVIAAGIGTVAEAIGTRTGVPFGNYEYADTLGPQVIGVPVVVALAWAMMAYPCLLAAQRLTTSRLRVVLIAAWALASWDLFLDPQMVGEGYWTWLTRDPALPGVPGIPLVNYAGWLLTALVIMTLLTRLPRVDVPRPIETPDVLLAWTYLSSVLANVAFFGRPWVALWGGVLMGIVLVPWMVARIADVRSVASSTA